MHLHVVIGPKIASLHQNLLHGLKVLYDIGTFYYSYFEVFEFFRQIL